MHTSLQHWSADQHSPPALTAQLRTQGGEKYPKRKLTLAAGDRSIKPGLHVWPLLETRRTEVHLGFIYCPALWGGSLGLVRKATAPVLGAGRHSNVSLNAPTAGDNSSCSIRPHAKEESKPEMQRLKIPLQMGTESPSLRRCPSNK